MTFDTEAVSRDNKVEFFGKAAFDIEHALGMYAISYCTLPAEGIYDSNALAPLVDVTKNCHIYLIGYTPRVDFVKAEQKDAILILTFEVLDNEYTVTYEIPDGFTLGRDGELYYLGDLSGQRIWPNQIDMQTKLCQESKALGFEVKYIGQAYGKDGSRNAIDRLLKHETLQQIALKGVPEGYRITLLLLEIQPSNQLITTINPFAKNTQMGGERIEHGLDKLFNTTEAERISLYEAALIRYFYPEFNKEFKDSFPSTNLKILQDCYKKDFSAVIAEICIDELPFRLWSSVIPPQLYHTAKHDLHRSEDRGMFFSL